MTKPEARRPRGRPRTIADSKTVKNVQSLERSLSLLKILSQADSQTLAELSQRAAMPTSTVHRILSTLSDNGFVQFFESDQTWGIGVEAFRIGMGFQRRNQLAIVGRGAMSDLMESSHETVNLGLLDQGEVVFVSQIECRQTIRAFFRTGERRAIHASGVGKALLSWMPRSKAADILHQKGMPRLTSHTITDMETMFGALDLFRRQGWAVDDEEASSGMRCAAAAIFNEYGEAIAGVSVSGPSARLSLERIASLGEMLLATAGRITASIGGIKPSPLVNIV